jgi:tetratricopeptide (TPR) repeat protein
LAALRNALPDTPDTLFEVAALSVRAGDAPRAGWLLEEGIERFPEREDIRLALARLSLGLGDPSLARESALAIPADSEHHLAALIAIAQADLALGGLELALETLAEAQRLYPTRPEARLVEIATLLRRRQSEEAANAIRETLAAFPGDDPESVALRRRLDRTFAQIQVQQGEHEAAGEKLNRLLAADPTDLAAWQVYIQLRRKEERLESVLPELEAALADDPYPRALLLLQARVYEGLGRDEEAVTSLRAYASASDLAGAAIPLVQHHAERGDSEAALAALDESLQRFPDDPALRMLRVELLIALERSAEARDAYERFRGVTFAGDPRVDYLQARLELAEGNPQAAVKRLHDLAPRFDRAPTQHWLGSALEEMGDYDGARRRYALASSRDPAWTAPKVALISLDQRAGNWGAVVQHAQALVRNAPGELGGWAVLVDALASQGRGQEAESVARRCLERFPDRVEPGILLAKALRAQGRTDEALAALDAAGADGPREELVVERVVTLGRGGRLAEAISLARSSLARTPDSSALHAALAGLLFAVGSHEEGSQATDRALELAPDEPGPLRVRCEFRASIADWPGAVSDCEAFSNLRPEDANAHFVLGIAHEGLGDTVAAIRSYRRAAELGPNDMRPRNNLAILLAADGDLDGALEAAQEAYRLAPEDPALMDTLGNLYAQKGLWDRAISLLEGAHERLPDHDEVALHLALAYRDAGRRGEAEDLLVALRREAQSDALRTRAEEALASLP